jgi:hypothetical protein
MTWNGTKTWTIGADGPFTASYLNMYARDNVQYNRDVKRTASTVGQGPVSTWSTGSSSYQDLGGTGHCQVQLRKRQVDTFPYIEGALEAYVDTALTIVRIGVHASGGGITPTDYDAGPFCFNLANTYETIYFIVAVWTPAMWPPVPPPVGFYTFTLRAKIMAGTGLVYFNSGFSFAMEAYEQSSD